MPSLTSRFARASVLTSAATLLPIVALSATTGPSAGSSPEVTLDDAQSRLSAPLLLARPNEGWVFQGRNMKWSTAEDNDSPSCSSVVPVCVHWTSSSSDAPPAADSDTDGVPNQVEATLAAARTSWDVIVDNLGFRAPLPDGRSRFNGGNNKFDIYLADTGDKDLAGYTSSDDPRLAPKSDYKFRDVSAFMVIDNDFDSQQFAQGSMADNLRVSVAHELFHASQFAYDYKEDRWFTEGTATWVEDVVFDDADLNRRALNKSQLKDTITPLDLGRSGHEYGSWIFFRYLSEKFGRDIIKRAWRLADDSAAQTSRDRMKTYSTRALGRALAEQKRDLHRVYAAFVRDNLTPKKTYSEGAFYPKPYSIRFTLEKRDGDTRWLGIPLNHLSSTYATIVPGDDVRRTGKVRLMLDGPPRQFQPKFQVTVRFKSGKSRDFDVPLDRKGDGSLRVGFGRNSVVGVDIAIINASTRMDKCFKRSTPYSCSGQPKDDNRTFRIRARLP